MLKWVKDYIEYVTKHPLNFNRDVKDNVRQIKELLSRKSIVYKEADPIAFEKFCRLFKHREGVLAGKPIVLNMEQKYIAGCILGIKEWSKEHNCYVRYFTEMDLFVARKWGKDHFVAPLICYFLGLDKEPSAWGQIVAENSNQSLRTFEIVEKEIKKEPLNQVFKKVGSKEKKQILCGINDGKLEYLSGRIKGKDGSNPSFAVANEIHEITNFNQYNALKTGMGARKQPMMLVISSAGITPESLFESLLERNRKFLRKLKLGKNDRIFALMYGIDDEDDPSDSSCWCKANPAMLTEGRPTMKFLQEQWQAMKDDPIMRNTFISKHLNRQIGAGIDYFDMVDIKNSMTTIKTDDIFDTYAVAGLDLSETTDLTNATLLIMKEDGKFIILQAYFIARECLDRNSKKDKVEYAMFEMCDSKCDAVKKLLVVTNGSYVDQRAVMDWFVWMRDEYKISILKIGYDRWMSKQFIELGKEYGFNHEKVSKEEDEVEIRDDGILTAVAQGGYTLSGSIKVIKSLFADGKLKFDRTNKLLPYCFYNLKIRADANNNLTPHKSKSSGHIDGAVALFNAFVAYDRAKNIYAEQIPDYFKI
jgi:phage terminase large subunit-like protein